jgi:hypothetical protein
VEVLKDSFQAVLLTVKIMDILMRNAPLIEWRHHKLRKKKNKEPVERKK